MNIIAKCKTNSFFTSWAIYFILLIVITPFVSSIDMEVSRFFYEHIKLKNITVPLFNLVYLYGPWPSLICASIASCMYLTTLFSDRFYRIRHHLLLLVLTMMIGNGLLTNTLLKDHWGRPRPHQIKEFGGKRSFLPFYVPDFNNYLPDRFKSFPCGHSTTGFYFLTFAVIGREEKNKRLTRLGIAIGIIGGIAIGLVRMMQGAHFVSDVLFAGFLMWSTILGLKWLIYDN